jgi:hypothetical protein
MIKLDIGAGVPALDTAASIALMDDRFQGIWHIFGGTAFVCQLSTPLLAESVNEGFSELRVGDCIVTAPGASGNTHAKHLIGGAPLILAQDDRMASNGLALLLFQPQGLHGGLLDVIPA